MKLIQQHRSVGSSEGLVSTVFGMDVSAKAFQILMGRLYSDRIKAVIREISTNAYDSHLANGNSDEPFDVHLPTVFEPIFSVRDYGTGLTDEELKHIYIVCFRSSKAEDEESTGCLGLGSKSPLSYVDSFIVESYKDGIKNIYTIHYNDENIPTLTSMGSEETTERNGLKIIVAVQSSDIRSFANKATEVYKFFKVKPNITGSSILLENEEPAIAGKSWKAFKRGQSYAIMSNVAYPIREDNSYFTKEQNEIINSYGLHIEFENGKLNFEPSRENLSYDKLTIKNLSERLSLVIKEIITEIQSQINQCDTLYDARILYHNMVKKNYSISNFFGLLTYKGESLSCVLNPKDMVGIYFKDITIYKNKIKEYSETNAIIINEKLRFYEINENDRYWKRRIINQCYGNNDINPYVIKFNSDLDRKLVIKLLGDSDKAIVNVESLPLPDKNSIAGQFARNKVSKINVYKEARLTTDCWTPEEIDLQTSSGVYVELVMGKIIGPNSLSTHANIISEILYHFTKIDVSPIKVYGIKTATLPLINNNPKWINFWDYCRQQLKNYIDGHKLSEVFSYINMRRVISNDYLANIANVCIDIPDNHSIKLYANEINYSKSLKTKYTDNISKVKHIISILGSNINFNTKPIIDIESWSESILETYPLLEYFKYGELSDIEGKHLSLYINQVDKEKI